MVGVCGACVTTFGRELWLHLKGEEGFEIGARYVLSNWRFNLLD